MLSKYKKAISEVKADDSLNERILLNIKQNKHNNKGKNVIQTIKKILISIGTLASLAACGGLVYAGIKSNKPIVDDYGITFSDKYDEYEYKFENQSVEADGTIIKLESAVCNEGYTVLKFDITLSDEIKEHADETVGLIYLSYNDTLDEDNYPRLSGSNYNLTINDKKQWLRGKYANEVRENIFNKNYTVYELYFIPDSYLDEKNTFTIQLEDFYLNVGEKLYSIPGQMKFELSKEEAVKASTEILGTDDYIKYRSLEQKIEKVIETPLQNLIKLQEYVADTSFTLTNENYPGYTSYTIYDQDGNELKSTYLDISLKYLHKDGSIEEGDIEDGKDDYSDVEKIITEKYVVTEKNDTIKNLLIKVYSTNEYYGTKVQIGEYKVDLVNKTISTDNSKEYVYRQVAYQTTGKYIKSNFFNINSNLEVNGNESIIEENTDNTYDSSIYYNIPEFTIKLSRNDVEIYKNYYAVGNIYNKANAIGYHFYIYSDKKYFDIIIMDKDKDYIFEDSFGNEIEKIKITENDVRAVYVLKEGSYNDYKDILDSITLNREINLNSIKESNISYIVLGIEDIEAEKKNQQLEIKEIKITDKQNINSLISIIKDSEIYYENSFIADFGDVPPTATLYMNNGEKITISAGDKIDDNGDTVNLLTIWDSEDGSSKTLYKVNKKLGEYIEKLANENANENNN